MAVQNTISNPEELKLVRAQIRRAKRIIASYKRCAAELEINIDSDEHRHKGDTYMLDLAVDRWEELVKAYNKTIFYLKMGVRSLQEVYEFTAAWMLSRGWAEHNGLDRNDYYRVRDGTLSLSGIQAVLTAYGVNVSIAFHI
ncbi:MAG: hypothetical protein HY426_05190 [Candidatus Levybacteria bacterium]|nr:hypothetical protein [Candidatus Levybacteria bacterium]